MLVVIMTAEPSGQDVSQRIRNAIKSKLVDIGCYVDDELPDYVMVMIANKKSKDQMKADLELFLGEYCGGFCDWLHQVLDHLQRFAREGKHKIDLFEEKSKSSKTKEKDKVHRWKDKERPAPPGSFVSGDEVALHLDVDEKREFEEAETKNNVENTKKRESRRSRSRSPLKKIEERTKKKLRERVDEVTKEVKRKEASRGCGDGKSESSSVSSRKRIEVDSSRDRVHTSSNSSSIKHIRSPERTRGSGSSSASRRSRVISPTMTRPQNSSKDYGRDHDRKEREKVTRDKVEPRQRGRAERKGNTDDRKDRRDEGDRKKLPITQFSSRKSKAPGTQEVSKKSPEVRIERTIENEKEETKRPPVPIKGRLTSTIGAVVTNDASSSDCEDEAEYDPSRPQLRSVATVAPRKRVFVDKDHLEKNKILAKALQDANRSTASATTRQMESLMVVGRRPDERAGPAKRSIQDRLGAYVTDAIAARVAEVKRRREMPPSLADDDDDDENMASNDLEVSGGEATNAERGPGPRIIVTMKRIPSDIDRTALDADKEVELEDLRLSLIRNSNAVAVTSGVKGEHINQQISTSAAAAAATASSSPAVVSSSQKSEEKGTILAVDSDGSQPVTALRKKMVVTNKNGVQVAPKATEVTGPVESDGVNAVNVTGGKPTAVTLPLVKSSSPEKLQQNEYGEEKDDNVIMRNGMIVKPSPLLAACGVNVNTALAIKMNPTKEEAAAKPLPGADLDAHSDKAPNQGTGTTVALRKSKSVIAEKIPLQSLDDLVPKSALLASGVNANVPMSSANVRRRQRCRFDPVCTNTICRFTHPGQLCSSFPLCGLPAASCLYRHPPCKFNHGCTNPNCLYAHSEDVFTANETGKPTPCKFFPNCTNSTCPFFHPAIPCKFGLRCQALGCQFVHPEKSVVAKLRWVANN